MVVTPKRRVNRILSGGLFLITTLLVGWWLPAGAVAQPEALEATGSSLTDKSDASQMGLMLQIRRLEENLALANTEAEYFHKKWLTLRLKTEAMGLQALTANEKQLENKAVELLGELFRSEKRLRELEDASTRFLEAGKTLKSSPAMQKGSALADYEAARRELERMIQGENEVDLQVAQTINDGRVTLYDDELGVAIVNFGKAQGAVTGLPFRIVDGNQVIGRCRIIEVREYLSAALVEDLLKGKTVQPGNRLLIDTVK